MTLFLSPARPEDRAAVCALLRACDLPDDFGAYFPAGYVVARHAGRLVGCAGLETYERAALLRSVAVEAGRRRTGLGRQLVDNRLSEARRAGFAAVYLLTTGAAPYFRELGFVDARRADAPESVRASTQFIGGVCASAACLVHTLTVPST